MDLMAIKALQQGKVDVAIALWKKVLAKMPIHKDTQNMRERIENSLKNL
jgi:cytochrome c-type biogenesis protein CcmH/NrfG